MGNYNFSTLNYLDFELLVCDLLNEDLIRKEMNGRFKSFKPGKDQGVDLLYDGEEKENIVVQVKHYINSSFSVLKRDLKKEVEKMKIISPERYIFATSLNLSLANKKDILEILKPYIKKVGDIYSNEDLNQLLRRYSNVEENHFKLWFCGANVLNRVLHKKFEGRLRQLKDEDFQRRLRLFVVNDDYNRAKIRLRNNKFIVLTGEPGVGKTFCSEMLLYDYLSKGFDVSIIYDDIREVEHKLRNDNTKQIFYFDDFLGHTQAEISKSKSAENYFYKILSKLKRFENKYMILNTRKFIFNSFLEESEIFRSSDLYNGEFKIVLDSHLPEIKLKIFKNHLQESDISLEKKKFLESEVSLICGHKNYNPRLIDFFTSNKYVKDYSIEDYQEFVYSNLSNPKEIWKNAFLFQIKDEDRILLITLYSLGSKARLEDLKESYRRRLEYERSYNSFNLQLDSFRLSLKRLNDGFIKIIDDTTDFWEFDSKKNKSQHLKIVEFINPSLEDFFNFFIEDNIEEKFSVLKSSTNIKQWYFFYNPFFDDKSKIEVEILDYFIRECNEKYGFENDNLFLKSIFAIYFDENTKVGLKILKTIKNWDFINDNMEIQVYLFKALSVLKSKTQINKIISNFSIEFFVNVLMSCSSIEEHMDIFSMLERHYGFSSELVLKNKLHLELTNELIEDIEVLIVSKVNQVESVLNVTKNESFHLDLLQELKRIFQFYYERTEVLFENEFKYMFERDWKQIAIENKIQNSIYDENFDPEYHFSEEYLKSMSFDYGKELENECGFFKFYHSSEKENIYFKKTIHKNEKLKWHIDPGE